MNFSRTLYSESIDPDFQESQECGLYSENNSWKNFEIDNWTISQLCCCLCTWSTFMDFLCSCHSVPNSSLAHRTDNFWPPGEVQGPNYKDIEQFWLFKVNTYLFYYSNARVIEWLQTFSKLVKVLLIGFWLVIFTIWMLYVWWLAFRNVKIQNCLLY